MIPAQKVDEILAAARIEEVIGEFVNLKKAGANYKGLSPWTNERTPSFTVSPAKGIFKDFSSGKGGNVCSFLMEHEHYTYPEALRWLAKRYNIEVAEEQPSPEAEAARNEKESLFVANEFACQWFENCLWNTDEGRTIGLSYFLERGMHESTIRKFRLGYNPEGFKAFTEAAAEKGYSRQYLLDLGLVKQKDERFYDGYTGRVMFPIQNLSGRTIGFGGRTLKADKTIPKYINSPENQLYNKSQTLYGIYLAKAAIGKADNCFLVEGYTDVIAFHQKGIENTVASSGTALTREQVKLVARYTQNITLVYDGDRAGIKASLRGIDIILEEGMHVKVVLLPDGHDPDSFSAHHDKLEVQDFLQANARDFIAFKADLLMADAAGDPVKTNEVVHTMVDSIALIPDTILRSIYVTECSRLMKVSERALVSELNKALRKRHRQFHPPGNEADVIPLPDLAPPASQGHQEWSLDYQERELLRLMVLYHDRTIDLGEDGSVGVVSFILEELDADQLSFSNTLYLDFLDALRASFRDDKLHISELMSHSDSRLAHLFIDLTLFHHKLDDWSRHDVMPRTEETRIRMAVTEALLAYKSKRIDQLIRENQEALLQNLSLGGSGDEFLSRQVRLEGVKRKINADLRRTIVH